MWWTLARRALIRPTSASTPPTSGATAGDCAPRRSSTRSRDSSRRPSCSRARPDPSPRSRHGPRLTLPTPRRTRSPTPEAGRSWASGQLVFNAGQFESARSGFADYAKDGEAGEQLRARVNRIILEDLEQKVLALRALHAKFRDMDAGDSFAGVVARSRPA